MNLDVVFQIHKINGSKVVEKIIKKIDYDLNKDNWYFFKIEHQPICFHINKINKIYTVEKTKSKKRFCKLISSEIENYYDLLNNKFKFNNDYLMSQLEYLEYLDDERKTKLEIISKEHHNCIKCTIDLGI